MIARRFGSIVFVGMLGLTACQYSFERGQLAPGVADPATALEFTRFVGPGGYALAIPVGATIEESDDGVRVEYSDASIISGSLIIEVEVLEAPVASSARELLVTLTADAPAASPIKSVPDMSIDGAMRSYAGPPGRICSETQLLQAAFLVGTRGYSLIIQSDAPSRCDAAAIPQAEPILQSFTAPRGTP